MIPNLNKRKYFVVYLKPVKLKIIQTQVVPNLLQRKVLPEIQPGTLGRSLHRRKRVVFNTDYNCMFCDKTLEKSHIITLSQNI